MRRLLTASASILLVATAPAAAAPGDLDRAFGTNGRLFVEGILGGLGEDGTGLSSLSTLSDGRIVLLGTERCSLSCDPFLVLSRRTPAGAPDPTLTAGRSPGVLVVGSRDDADPKSTSLFGAAVRPDGGLVTGRTLTGTSSLVAYGPDGVAAAPVPSARPVAPEVVLPDGRVLGRAGRSLRSVVRLTAALTADPAFGAGRALGVPAGLREPLPLTVGGPADRLDGAGPPHGAGGGVQPDGAAGGRRAQWAGHPRGNRDSRAGLHAGGPSRPLRPNGADGGGFRPRRGRERVGP